MAPETTKASRSAAAINSPSSLIASFLVLAESTQNLQTTNLGQYRLYLLHLLLPLTADLFVRAQKLEM
jgi:hypothetical protein